MGSAASTQSLLVAELSKPLDAHDLDDKAAKDEVIRLRSLLRTHEQAVLKMNTTPSQGAAAQTPSTTSKVTKPAPVQPVGPPKKVEPFKIKSPHSRANVAKFDNHDAKNFKLDDCPEIKDYLMNEFVRFAGKDEVLEWDEFWRFMHDLELGLNDQEIAALRQKADINADGVIEWDEMLSVIQPILGKYWQASLAGAPEYLQWTELHWETHHTVEKDADGYTRKGHPFYVNKLTQENTWEKPAILSRHASLQELKKDRNVAQAPSLEDVLGHAFTKHSGKGTTLNKEQFWKVVTEELHLDPALSKPEMEQLHAEIDANKDGKVDWQEFVAVLVPKLAYIFRERKGANEWVALTYYAPGGGEYLYWYNRVSGKSTWDNPTSKKKRQSTVGGGAAAAAKK